jgi:hypothetical protein
VSRPSGWARVWVTLAVRRHRATNLRLFFFFSSFLFFLPIPAGSCAFGFYPTLRSVPPPLVIDVAPVLESPVPPSAVAGYYCWLASKIAKETRRDECVFSHVASPASSSGSVDFLRKWRMAKPVD